jgi:hypothetical protein
MFCAGSCGSRTPTSTAVCGINCMSPRPLLGHRVGVEAGLDEHHRLDEPGVDVVLGGGGVDQTIEGRRALHLGRQPLVARADVGGPIVVDEPAAVLHDHADLCRGRRPEGEQNAEQGERPQFHGIEGKILTDRAALVNVSVTVA